MSASRQAINDDMKSQGWVFSANHESRIGSHVRKRFSGHGEVNGTVVAYLPASVNDGYALWHVVHDDGDSEDMDENEIDYFMDCYRQYSVQSSSDRRASCRKPERTDELENYSNEDICTDDLITSDCSDVDVFLSWKVCSRGVRVGESYQVSHIPEIESNRLHDNANYDNDDGCMHPQLDDSDSWREIVDLYAFTYLKPGRVVLVGDNETGKRSVVIMCVIAVLNSEQVVLYDGNSHRRMPMSRILILHEDFLLRIWHSCTTYIQWKEKIMQHCANSLDSQYTSREVTQFLQVQHKYGSNLLLIWGECKSKLARIALTEENVEDISFRRMVSMYFLLQPMLCGDREGKNARRIHSVYFTADMLLGRNLVSSFFVLKVQEWMIFCELSQSVVGAVCSKPVEQLDMNTGEVVAVYSSLTAAATAICKDRKSISACCYNPNKACGGFKWKFKNASTDDISDQADPSYYYRDFDVEEPFVHEMETADSQVGSAEVKGKAVQRLDFSTGKVITTYPSNVVASKATGARASSITKCCKGISHSAGGFMWRYAPQNDVTVANNSVPQTKVVSCHHQLVGAANVDQESVCTQVKKKPKATVGQKSSGPGAKAVEMVDIATGEVLNVFCSGKEAAMATGLTSQSISDCCRGVSNRRFGDVTFRFQDSQRGIGISTGSPGEHHRLEKSASSSDTARGYTLPTSAENLDIKTGDNIAPLPVSDQDYYYWGVEESFVHEMETADSQVGSAEVKGKAVQRLDFSTGKVITTYPSNVVASKATGARASSITKCCKGISHSAGGFMWRYAPQNDVTVANNSVPQTKVVSCHHQLVGAANVDQESVCTQVKKKPKATVGQKSSGPGAKAVEMVDIATGEVLNVFCSGKEAAMATGLTSQSISDCCRGVSNRRFGDVTFRFQDSQRGIGISTGSPGEHHRLEKSASSSDTAREYTLPTSAENLDMKTGDNIAPLLAIDQDYYHRGVEESFVHEMETADSQVGSAEVKGKAVQRLDFYTGKVITTYPSNVVASKATGARASSITKCCKGISHSAGGFMWRYAPQNDVTVANNSVPQTKVVSCHHQLVGAANVDQESVCTQVKKKPKATVGQKSSGPGAKAVEMVDIATGEVLNVFCSGKEAAMATGLTSQSISDCCRGVSNRRFGDVTFRFQDSRRGIGISTGSPGEHHRLEKSASSSDTARGYTLPTSAENLDLATIASVDTNNAVTSVGSRGISPCCPGQTLCTGEDKCRLCSLDTGACDGCVSRQRNCGQQLVPSCSLQNDITAVSEGVSDQVVVQSPVEFSRTESDALSPSNSCSGSKQVFRIDSFPAVIDLTTEDADSTSGRHSRKRLRSPLGFETVPRSCPNADPNQL